jgi:hypothetical protein
VQVAVGEVIGIYIDVSKDGKRPQVIDTSRVVIVLMCEQHAVESVEGNA